MKKLYDDYDYEEAYQKQCDTLEEWELEKLLKDGKVGCLYRTTTTKAENSRTERYYWKARYTRPLRIKRICQ